MAEVARCVFVILVLAGCVSSPGGSGQGAEPALSARRASRHQWYALAGSPEDRR
jgi:hypothetical protein